MFDTIKSTTTSYIDSQNSGLSHSKPALAEAVSLVEIGQLQSGPFTQGLPTETPINPSTLLKTLEGLPNNPLISKIGSILADNFAKSDQQVASGNGEDALLTGGQDAVTIDAGLAEEWPDLWTEAIAPLLTEAIPPDTEAQLQSALGQQWTADNIQDAIIDGVSELKLELLPASTLQAKGAFAAENQTIYLADDWASTQSLDAVTDVLLEEVGHFIDYKFGQTFNTPDTAGDEGAIFSALVQGKPLTPEALAELQAENDQGQIFLDDQVIDVEQAALSQARLDRVVGTFSTGADGKAAATFLFDGSNYEGEVAVFNTQKMGGLSTKAFTKEAARRALRGGNNGQIIIKDKTEAAQFSGKLDSRDYNRGKRASTRTIKLAPNARFGIIFAPKGSLSQVAAGKQQAIFSIAAHNPGGKALFGRATKDVYAFEDNSSSKSDRDYNDVVMKISGATGKAAGLSKLIPSSKNWLRSSVARPFLRGKTQQPKNNNVVPETPIAAPIKPKTPVVAPVKPNTPVVTPVTSGGGFTRDISTSAVKVRPSFTEAELIKRGAKSVKIGTQTIYIGTEQVSPINQNPVVFSFDKVNKKNNWTRTDIETTGTDGRGLGLVWTGKGLYGVFSVDGTQGTKNQDFRRATGGATQNWLKSYGSGGGTKIAVVGQIDPATGKLLKAAHLSAVLSNGKTNALSVNDITVNNAGNLVVKAKSFFSPRRPDGKAMTRNPGNSAGSPFDYTLELKSDLSKVVRTSAPGWS
ncbi:MAG: DUF4114 domain-containing protein [Cyanobacteria bacterium P01_A01_bin.116]